MPWKRKGGVSFHSLLSYNEFENTVGIWGKLDMEWCALQDQTPVHLRCPLLDLPSSAIDRYTLHWNGVKRARCNLGSPRKKTEEEERGHNRNVILRHRHASYYICSFSVSIIFLATEIMPPNM